MSLYTCAKIRCEYSGFWCTKNRGLRKRRWIYGVNFGRQIIRLFGIGLDYFGKVGGRRGKWGEKFDSKIGRED